MKKIWFINNPELTDENAVVVYSALYNSISIRIDSSMFENDGKCPGGSFWGVDKARSNSFMTFDIVETEKRLPMRNELCIDSKGNLFVSNEVNKDEETNVVIASSCKDLSPNDISKQTLEEIRVRRTEFKVVIKNI